MANKNSVASRDAPAYPFHLLLDRSPVRLFSSYRQTDAAASVISLQIESTMASPGRARRVRSKLDDSLCWRGVQSVANLAARGDAELGEDAIEVRADGAVRHVELLADLAVGEPRGGHAGDLQLLRRQLVHRAALAWAAGDTGAAQLVACPLGPGQRAQRVERVAGGAQRHARLSHPPLAAQPGTERELEPRAGKRPVRQIRIERGPKEVFGLFVFGQQGAGVLERDAQPRRACLGEDGLHLGQDGAGLLEMPAVARRLREISDRPAALQRVPGRVPVLERAVRCS